MTIKRIMLQFDATAGVRFDDFLAAAGEYVRTKGAIRFERMQPIHVKLDDGSLVLAGTIRGNSHPMVKPPERTNTRTFRASLRDTVRRLWDDADATVIKRYQESAAESEIFTEETISDGNGGELVRHYQQPQQRMWLYVFRLELVYPSFTDDFIHTGRIAVVRLTGVRKRPGVGTKEEPADLDDLRRLSPKLYGWLPRVGLPADDEYAQEFFDALPDLVKDDDD